MLGKFFYRYFVRMNAKQAKEKIDALKKRGIQRGALASQMGMSDKVFSTRTSKGNWTQDELARLDKITKKYPS